MSAPQTRPDSHPAAVAGEDVDTAGRLPILGLAALLLAALIALSAWLWQSGRQPLLLVPAIGGLNACLDLVPPHAGLPQPSSCDGPQGSAAEVIEQYLQQLGPRQSPDGHFQVGYTLVLPLLDFFQSDSRGGWAIDQTAVQRVTHTVAGVDRPVVLYFFSTHFGVQAPIEPALAADPRNLAETPEGPLPVDRYMGQPLYPWSIARTDNAITARREQALRAIVDALCQQPPAVRRRIAGVNLLGEVHQLYPHFETGMGDGASYVVTDYSAASRTGFRVFLRRRFGTVAALDAALGVPFTAFKQIEPPANETPGAPFWQRLDAHSAGQFAVSGWARDLTRPAPDADPAAAPWVRVYMDGQEVERVSAHYVRQDVSAARPDLGTALVGWNAGLDYRDLAPGLHRIDVALEQPQAGATHLIHLGTRRVTVFDPRHPDAQPQVVAPMRQPLPSMAQPGGTVQFWIDAPADDLALRYNPLAPLWNTFRGQQVVDYLENFSDALNGTCLAAVPRRTQQIYPATGAGWDETRFASALSRRPFGNVQLGVNLYGEATDAPAFFDELARNRQPGYSVTEFHPLRALTAPQLRAVLEAHRAHGAHTLSFFFHPAPRDAQGHPVIRNPFSIDPDNPEHGSDMIYHSLVSVLAGRPEK
jgi:hypothetical protein